MNHETAFRVPGFALRALAAGALATAVALGAPVAAHAETDPGATASAAPTPTPTPEPTSAGPRPSSSPSSEPSSGPTPSKPRPPASASADVDKPKKKKPEQKKEKKPAVVDMAVVLAAAQRQLDNAKPDIARAERALQAAQRADEAARAKLASLRANLTITEAVSLGDPAQSAVRGLRTALLPIVSAPAQAPLVTKEMLTAAQRDVEAAAAALADAKAAHQLVKLNIATAKATLGLASGTLTATNVARQFASYPVGECSFPDVRNPSDCRQAQRWAIEQTVNPVKNWDHLCLNLVTMAYGWSSGAPTAIAMWNGLPQRRKHSPNTVAPPGALMFWGPNHVAMSLGNNVMVSNDVLGVGRAWIVSFETIQAVWGFQYLGWSEPDFSHD